MRISIVLKKLSYSLINFNQLHAKVFIKQIKLLKTVLKHLCCNKVI